MKRYFLKPCVILTAIIMAAVLSLLPLMVCPLKAGAVPSEKDKKTDLPWEGSPEFQKAAGKAGTHIRMAVYSATLKDPLPGELFNVGHAADKLAGIVVQPGATYSQNKTLGPYTAEKGYKKGPTYAGYRIITTVGGGVCKIASVTYNIVRLSNLQVIERHNHSMTVPYVPPGQDATVYYGSRDFKFRNNTAGPVMLWAKLYGSTLKIALYGQQLPPKVTWQHKTLKNLKSWTIYQFNSNLAPGAEKLVTPGQEGIVVRSSITVRYFNGKVETRDLGRDYYAASPRIIEKGPRR